MKNFEEIMAELEKLGDDVTVYADEEKEMIDVTFEDFEGFDDDWCEIEREYDNPEAVENFLEMLEAECISKEDDFYKKYFFDGFYVEIGYSSYDI